MSVVTKVSLLVHACCLRSTRSPASTVWLPFASENTIQPLCQGVAAAAQLVPVVDTQTVTGRPSLTASARAYCNAADRPLTSPATRFVCVRLTNDGTGVISRRAA